MNSAPADIQRLILWLIPVRNAVRPVVRIVRPQKFKYDSWEAPCADNGWDISRTFDTQCRTQLFDGVFLLDIQGFGRTRISPVAICYKFSVCLMCKQLLEESTCSCIPKLYHATITLTPMAQSLYFRLADQPYILGGRNGAKSFFKAGE